MSRIKKNPNNHKRVTPATARRQGGKIFTSYDITEKQSSTPQKVREQQETPAVHAREKKAKGE